MNGWIKREEEESNVGFLFLMGERRDSGACRRKDIRETDPG
jgi:hypothetical protein